MDLKIFYKGKNRGEEQRVQSWPERLRIKQYQWNIILSNWICFSFKNKVKNKSCTGWSDLRCKHHCSNAQTEVVTPCSSGHNACADQPCSLLCLPQPGHRHTCVCPEGAPTITMPSGELQCQCPTGYQLQNNTCVKTGEAKAQAAELLQYCSVKCVWLIIGCMCSPLCPDQSTAVCPTSTAALMGDASAASGSVTATMTAETWVMSRSVVSIKAHSFFVSPLYRRITHCVLCSVHL